MTGRTAGAPRCCIYEAADGLADLHNPYMNLAREEFLIRYAAGHQGLAILYLWQNADCVVFGRNQNPSNECRLGLMKTLGVLPVRRKTGGGAVFHDLQNLNYSFIVPEGFYDRDTSMQIVIRALQNCGIDAMQNGRNDIVCGNGKVSGNAYLKKDGVCLHHGTLLIGADTGKMERLLTVDKAKFSGKGISSVRSRVKNLNEIMPNLTAEDYMHALKGSFLECYAGGRDAVFESLLPEKEDREYILGLYRAYASEGWIFGHESGQEWQSGGHFDWGNCTVSFSGGSYKIYSDTLYAEAFGQVKKAVEETVQGRDFPEKLPGISGVSQEKMFRDIYGLIRGYKIEN